MRRREQLLGAALLFAWLAILGSRRLTRVAVVGHSMEPSLRDGDWLAVWRSPVSMGVGDIVVARDPRERTRLIVKCICVVGTDSRLVLTSDHPAHAGEVIGPVDPGEVVGRVWLRYWPPSRAGLI